MYGKFNVEPKKKTEAQNPQKGDDAPQIRDDQVEITDKAIQLHKSDTSQAIDYEKVEAIKKSIADGTFKIDAEKIADKMIQQELELYRRNKQ